MELPSLISPTTHPLAGALEREVRQALAALLQLGQTAAAPQPCPSDLPQAVMRDMVSHGDRLVLLERVQLVGAFGEIDPALGQVAAAIAACLDDDPRLRPTVLALLDMWMAHQAEPPADCLEALYAGEMSLQLVLAAMID